MRIAGYLVAALLGILGGWLLFAPTEEAPPPKADPPVAASPPVLPWTPPPAPEATWRESAPSPVRPASPSPPEAFSYRPLSEREQQRLKAGGGVLYPREPAGYPAPAWDPYRANPGYDFRPPDRR